ncbi:MAG: transcription elongation factor GreA, partial [Actinomycetales bacterium]
AREEQGKTDARIRQLEDLLRRSEVGEKPADDAVDLDVYSPTSPLGAAILGKKAGDEASYETPTGATISVEVVEAKPF